MHPTFFYESVWNLAVFFFLIWFRNRKKQDGELLLFYALLYGFGRFFIEGLRTDSLMLGLGGLRVSQLLSALLFIVCIAAFIIIKRNQRKQAAVAAALEEESDFSGLLEKIQEEGKSEVEKTS